MMNLVCSMDLEVALEVLSGSRKWFSHNWACYDGFYCDILFPLPTGAQAGLALSLHGQLLLPLW